MKLTDLWKSRSKPTLSFEIYPARSEKAAISLENALIKLAALAPDFVSVTFGAGGTTREGSRQLVQKMRQEKDIETLAYFAGFGLSPDEITAVIDDYQALGVENLLVVRGDKPHDETFEPHPKSFNYASELMEFIRPRYELCLGVAGYPEAHIDAESRAKDMEVLKLKVEKGAEFIVCNYFYDNQYFFDYIERCHTAGINVPILPGVMPIYSVKVMRVLARLCGATITEKIETGLASLPENDKDALNDFGVDFAFVQCAGLIEAGVPGLHIYTMDRSLSTVGLVSRLRNEGLL